MADGMEEEAQLLAEVATFALLQEQRRDSQASSTAAAAFEDECAGVGRHCSPRQSHRLSPPPSPSKRLAGVGSGGGGQRTAPALDSEHLHQQQKHQQQQQQHGPSSREALLRQAVKAGSSGSGRAPSISWHHTTLSQSHASASRLAARRAASDVQAQLELIDATAAGQAAAGAAAAAARGQQLAVEELLRRQTAELEEAEVAAAAEVVGASLEMPGPAGRRSGGGMAPVGQEDAPAALGCDGEEAGKRLTSEGREPAGGGPSRDASSEGDGVRQCCRAASIFLDYFNPHAAHLFSHLHVCCSWICKELPAAAARRPFIAGLASGRGRCRSVSASHSTWQAPSCWWSAPTQ